MNSTLHKLFGLSWARVDQSREKAIAPPGAQELRIIITKLMGEAPWFPSVIAAKTLFRKSLLQSILSCFLSQSSEWAQEQQSTNALLRLYWCEKKLQNPIFPISKKWHFCLNGYVYIGWGGGVWRNYTELSFHILNFASGETYGS